MPKNLTKDLQQNLYMIKHKQHVVITFFNLQFIQ